MDTFWYQPGPPGKIALKMEREKAGCKFKVKTSVTVKFSLGVTEGC